MWPVRFKAIPMARCTKGRVRDFLAMARGSPKAPVEAARKDKKRHDPKRPHWKRADAVRVYAAFAARYQFQDAGHAERKPVNHQCGYDHGGPASPSALDEDYQA